MECTLCEDTGILILYMAKGDKRWSEYLSLGTPDSETEPLRIQSWEEAQRHKKTRDGYHWWHCPLCWRGKLEFNRVMGRVA